MDLWIDIKTNLKGQCVVCKHGVNNGVHPIVTKPHSEPVLKSRPET